MAAYCRKLVEAQGDDGGFILGSGCSLPADVKLDNFRSMVETGKAVESSRRQGARRGSEPQTDRLRAMLSQFIPSSG